MELSQRYWITQYIGDSVVIWDSRLGRNLGNGKYGPLVLDCWAEAESVVDVMAQRVGA